MKKKVLVLLAFFAIIPIVNAQSEVTYRDLEPVVNAIENQQVTLQEIYDFVDSHRNNCLKKLFPGETIKVKATDGNRTIFESKEVFESWIDPDFKNWNLNKPSQKTSETEAQVYEMVQNANFKQMFGSLNDDLDNICWTQHQIVGFCKNHQDRLHSLTFFLFKENGAYFVACVCVLSDGLDVHVNRFECGGVWGAEDAPRVVVPQLDD